MEEIHKECKILCIGNSFSEDTVRYAAEMARSAGCYDVAVVNLYIGGCPIHKHNEHVQEDTPIYRYDRNVGDGWHYGADYKISSAIREELWDWIVIQHGSSYGGRYTEEGAYSDLPALVDKIRSLASADTKIAFNMTWTGEETHNHVEMQKFHRNQRKLFEAICDITQRMVGNVDGIDRIVPTGTAVQNARTTALKDGITRDGYHLSYDLGRYLAGMVLLKSLFGIPCERIPWKPETVTEQERDLVMRAIREAVSNPFSITQIR